MNLHYSSFQCYFRYRKCAICTDRNYWSDSFLFNVVFDLSGSRGKWSLSDVSLIVSWQLLFTQRFNCCYCCSWFNVWLHHRYFKGCCPYTRWDFEMNKCVGKLLKIWKNTIFYLYSLYLQITSYLADIVFKHFPIASIFIS